MTLCFALTPAPERFAPPSQLSSFAVYAVLAAIYMVGAAGAVAWSIGRNLALVKGKTLRAALMMVTVGNGTEIPFMTIRTLQRLTLRAGPELLVFAFLLNTARFILIPLGCAIAAMEPSRKTMLYYYRRIRLYPLWHLLRSATIELALASLVSRTQDALATDDAWERLHRRVVEVHDSIFYLYDGWARPELVDQSTRQTRVLNCGPTACWLEVARREALRGIPKRYCVNPDRELLPRVLAQESSMRVEVRYLMRLHRALKSRSVQAFADTVVAR